MLILEIAETSRLISPSDETGTVSASVSLPGILAGRQVELEDPAAPTVSSRGHDFHTPEASAPDASRSIPLSNKTRTGSYSSSL
jgi:hypothetical protein